MKILYTILFALSIILINPWGKQPGPLSRTSPKVFVIWLIVGVNLALLSNKKKALTIPRQWKISLIMWTIFISTGAISTLQSPFPLNLFLRSRSNGRRLAQTGPLIAAFTLSNSLLLIVHPQLINSQFQGLLIGGTTPFS